MIGTNTPSPQRFLATSALALLAACGSSGDNDSSSPNAPPVITTAAFTGVSATPAANDTLVLSFSTQIRLISSTALTDADFTLSGGATLGNLTTSPTTPNSNSVQITLGAGTSFVPGTTTIALSSDNDVIAGVGLTPTGGGTAVTIGTSDGVAPTISNVTISAIDDELNGTGAAGGTLQVPTTGWTIDLAYADASPIETTQTVITANVAVTTSAGILGAGSNLRASLTEVSASNTAASYQVPSTVTFAQGSVILTCIVADTSGLSSLPATFSATVRTFPNALRPFETTVNPSQVWFLDFARDVESFTTTTNGSDVTVNVVDGSNSRSDFEDMLRILGLNSASPIPNVSGTDNSNQVVIDRIQQALLTDLANYYSGANVMFTLTKPSGNFGSSSSVDYATFGYSQISIAGASSTAGVLGLAIFDPKNETQNDNTRTDFAGTGGAQRLGVFLHTIIDSGIGSNSASNFRMTYDTFTPSRAGTAIGDDGQDGARLNGTVGDARETALDTAIADFARFIATVTAHECGHSVGLVENGAMPTGLYGNDATNFPGSADGHIRNTSLFPSGVNVMSPALSYSTATSLDSMFNTLNMAYLREQVFYNGN